MSTRLARGGIVGNARVTFQDSLKDRYMVNATLERKWSGWRKVEDKVESKTVRRTNPLRVNPLTLIWPTTVPRTPFPVHDVILCTSSPRHQNRPALPWIRPECGDIRSWEITRTELKADLRATTVFIESNHGIDMPRCDSISAIVFVALLCFGSYGATNGFSRVSNLECKPFERQAAPFDSMPYSALLQSMRSRTWDRRYWGW